MGNERSTRIREILNIAIQSLEDDLALEIIDMFPEWEAGLEMRVGKRIRYKNNLYKIMQTHFASVGLEPEKAPSLFQEIISFANAEVVGEWEPGMICSKGQKVMYEGTIRNSLIDENGYRPNDSRGWITIL